jgi:radical SAM superfamily enzyme YgiQ (UPF0313 family)
MRLLMLQFVDPTSAQPQAVFNQDLGVVCAMLKGKGIDCRLAAMNGYRPVLLEAAIDAYKPQAVLVELRAYSVTAARRTIGDLAQRYHLPVAVCGQWASCQSERAFSIPGVKALLPGEYHHAAVELMLAWSKDPAASLEGVAGLWTHSNGSTYKGKLPGLVEDLDSLPFADRELFDAGGPKRGGQTAFFKVARGCPHWCGHCLNDWYMDLYQDKGSSNKNFVRRRSPMNVLDEIAQVVSRYPGTRQIAFYDHCFVDDAAWLKEFTSLYPRRCSLPYRCNVNMSHVNNAMAAMLAAGLCNGVVVQMGSGSRFIREDIFSIHLSDEHIVHACRTLAKCGLPVTAEVFIGAPYESQITIEETLELLRKAQVHQVRHSVFYPTPGTRAAEVCAENGWISGRGEENYWLGKSVLDMPSMPAAQIDAVMAKFPAMLKTPGSTAIRKLLQEASQARDGRIAKLLGKRTGK